MLPPFLRGLADSCFYIVARTQGALRIGAVDAEGMYPVDQSKPDPLYNCRVLDLCVTEVDGFADSEDQLKLGTYLDEIAYSDFKITLERDWPAEVNEGYEPVRVTISLRKSHPGRYSNVLVGSVNGAQDLNARLTELDARGALAWLDIGDIG